MQTHITDELNDTDITNVQLAQNKIIEFHLRDSVNTSHIYLTLGELDKIYQSVQRLRVLGES